MLAVTKMTQYFGGRFLGLRLLSGHWLYVPSVFWSQNITINVTIKRNIQIAQNIVIHYAR